MHEQGLINTSVPDEKNGVIIRRDFAEEHKFKIGDELDVSLQYDNDLLKYLQDGLVVIADIVPSFPYPNDIYDMVIDWETSVFDTDFQAFETAFIEADDSKKALGELEGVKEVYPEIQVSSLEQSRKQSNEMAVQRWV